MNILRSMAITLATVTCCGTLQAGGDGWVDLFDGKTLNGWTQHNGTATYVVKDATIHGTTAEGSPNSFLCTAKDYSDFELVFDVKVDNALNSGCQIRSRLHKGKGKRVNGPQVEIEASGAKGAEAGYIYGEACGGWMTPEDKRKPHKHFKDGEWNSYRVLAEGPRIQVWVNGTQVSDLTDDGKFKSHPKGFIGLQVHSIKKGAGPYSVAWRNIRIREIESATTDASSEDWITLFDGSNLDQWRETKGNWKIEDGGVLLIEPRKGETGWSRYGHYLYSKEQFSDFVIEAEYMYPKGGNSGIYFRIGDLSEPTQHGMEMQILDSFGKEKNLIHHDHGGIIRTFGPSKNMSKAPGEWNKARLTAKGHHLTVELNGETIIDKSYGETQMKDRPMKGHIGLQDHGFGNNIRFRNIRIKRL